MRYKLLGRSGLRVSELALGALAFGEAWGNGAPKPECRRIFDRFLEAGGNFVDTANKYIDGTSETFVGEFLEGRRERVVLATKYSLTMRPDDPNGGGNHRKSLHEALNASLRRLKTDYIDLYWVHNWDFMTPVDEVLRGLDDAVRAGKVLYIGISNTPAWIVAQANTIAELRGWTRFVGLQIEYSLIERTPEREFLPMARALDLAVAAWAPLSGGVLTGKYSGSAEHDQGVTKRLFMNQRFMNARNLAIAQTVQQVAEQSGRRPSEIALNWVRRQRGVVIPIVGARSLDQLNENLGCLDFELAPEQLARLEEVSRVPLGYPYEFNAIERIQKQMHGDMLGQVDNHRKT
jgi:aryl-alcohol dehydrogenase-like predicted oxidoreductase